MQPHQHGGQPVPDVRPTLRRNDQIPPANVDLLFQFQHDRPSRDRLRQIPVVTDDRFHSASDRFDGSATTTSPGRIVPPLRVPKILETYDPAESRIAPEIAAPTILFLREAGTVSRVSL